MNNVLECIKYFERAEKIFNVLGNVKIVKEIQQKKEQLLGGK
jgi:hypothetical protein